ncbi:ribosome biogenesis protein Nop16 [Gongronella butleri]|nr:ribosome biogenesis protein Nop16 [Gongronella butleri]
MVTPSKRRTQRSGRKNTRRTGEKSKRISFQNNPYIKQNWDKKQTLLQNYRRLGLSTRLNGKAAGGVEKLYADEASNEVDSEPKELKELTEDEIEKVKRTLAPGEGLIQRDDEGNVIRIIVGEKQSHNDILDAPIIPVEAQTDFVRELEAQAANVPEKAKEHVSSSESAWLDKLIAKHGDDYQAMFWDKELNINQFTVAKLKKHIKHYQKFLASQQE